MHDTASGEDHRFPALRYRDFRLLWAGQMISSVGSQMQVIAVNWHVYDLMDDKTYTLTLFGQSLTLAGDALGTRITSAPSNARIEDERECHMSSHTRSPNRPKRVSNAWRSLPGSAKRPSSKIP